MKKGEQFRVVDLYGVQIIDFVAWVSGTNLTQKMSMSYTRYHLGGVPPVMDECLYTNADEPIFRIVEDTVKVRPGNISAASLRYHPKNYTSIRKKVINMETSIDD
jgi:uncharacterized protein YcgI (DUF1989 family)